MLDAPITLSHRKAPAPDWDQVAPELARAGRGRRTLLIWAVLGLVANALIGLVGVLAPEIVTGMDLDRDEWVSAALATVSIVVLVVVLRASRRQSADQAVLMEAFHGMISPQVIVDASGYSLLANRAYMAWLGERGDNAEVVLRDYFGGDQDAVRELQRLTDGAHAGQLLTSEIRLKLSNGDVEWRRIVARPLRGWPGYIIWRLEDVSERRRIEERLREEQNKLMDFMSQAPVGIYSVDQSGRFTFVNQTLAVWLGTTPDEMMSGDVRLHDVLAKPPSNALPYVLSSGPEGERRGDLIMKGLQGRSFPVSINQTVLKSADGLEVRTRSVVRDLTPEQRWQEALSLSEQRFQRLFTDAPVGIVLIDDQIRVVECNQTFVNLIGASQAEILSQTFTDLLPAEDRHRVRDRLLEELKATEVARPFEIMVGSGDRLRALQVFARRFTTAQTTRGGLMLHFIDATEQKKLQSQFVQSQKMQAVGQLAGGIAHDFNNLLTAMIGFCDLLLLRHKPGDQSFSDLMQIKQNANRAANLVRQLLAFSRQQTLQPTVLDLTDELADLSNLLRRLIGANIDLRVVHGRDVWPVKVDRVQLEQVVINLAVNARDAMQPQGGKLAISTRNHVQEKSIMRGQEEMPPGDYTVIEVDDTGSGIPPAIMARIFEPFFSTKEIGAGTGLGLSTVYGIVRQTGGFVGVDSTVGVGTKFTVYLPRHVETEAELAKAEAIKNAPADAPALDLTGVGTILMVEDEDAVRTFSTRALKNKGYNILEARSGEEALEVIKDNLNNIDLIISDVVMPQMDGPTMVKELARLYPDHYKQLKIIFVSGYTEDRLREQFDAGEVFGFIPKPFTLKQLAEKVKEVLG